MRELIGHCHAVEAVDVAAMSNSIVGVWKPIVHLLTLLQLLLLELLLHLLLLCQFVFEDLVVLGCILLDLRLGFTVQI